MTEYMQARCVQNFIMVFVRCCLKYDFLLGFGAGDENLYFRIALHQVNSADYRLRASFGQTPKPYVNAVAVSGGGVCKIAVIERINHIGKSRVS